MKQPAIIGVDWGSSRLRCYAVAADGEIRATVHSDSGVLVTRQKEHAGELLRLLADWRARWPDVPIVASGMVGSRGGLKETAYLSTPAGTDELRRGLDSVVVGDATIALVPGLIHHGEHGVDVMRGEETVLAGWSIMRGPDPASVVVLPGTHSKWARVADHRVIEFCTFPTGELFDSLLHSGALRDLLPTDEAHDASAFRDGVERGLAAQGLLHDYFSVRAEVVTGTSPARSIRSHLSGLLVGYEITEASRRMRIAPDESLVIVGQGRLALRYAEAMRLADLTATDVSAEQCLARGWLAVRESATPGGHNTGRSQ